MSANLRPALGAALTLLLCSCAGTSIQQTWKSPVPHSGPVQNVAVLAVDERELVRGAIEVRFVNQLKAHGQNAFATEELLSLPAIKADKSAAAARLREQGADAVLIMRMVDRATHARSVRATENYAPTLEGYESGDWFSFYSVAYMDMGTIWSNTRMDVYLDTSLFDLKSGHRLWSATTVTVLKEETDRLEEINPLAEKILAAMRKDGVIK